MSIATSGDTKPRICREGFGQQRQHHTALSTHTKRGRNGVGAHKSHRKAAVSRQSIGPACTTPLSEQADFADAHINGRPAESMER
eukprot:3694135-Rhodomonas_salina.2